MRRARGKAWREEISEVSSICQPCVGGHPSGSSREARGETERTSRSFASRPAREASALAVLVAQRFNCANVMVFPGRRSKSVSFGEPHVIRNGSSNEMNLAESDDQEVRRKDRCSEE